MSAAGVQSPAGPSAYGAGTRVAVLTTQPIDGPLDYLAPEEGCTAGDYVVVPLGRRLVVGVVWGEGEGEIPREKLRTVDHRLDVPPMRPALRAFLARAAAYTLTPLSAMLRLATRTPGLDAPGTRRVYRRGEGEPDRLTPARRRVLEVLEAHGGVAFAPAELASAAGVSGSVVKGLVASGAVIEGESPRDAPFPRLDPARSGPDLAPDQAAAARALRAGVSAGTFATTLLKGVTGSGKTEVYLDAVAACLESGRQALVLLPEIALTSEFLSRVESRFGARPAEWHHGVSQAERRRAWRMVAEGGAELVVGARSALFLPFRDLGLLVVDEEHDSAYKQEDGVLYHARDMAVLRASLESAHVVLASATPSLETWANAEAGKYARLDLSSRFGAGELPAMRPLDMRTESLPPGRWIGGALAESVRARLATEEQALLFLNRRGYAPVTVCRACGHQLGCDHCDARLVEHRFQKRLVCHQCGETHAIPDSCPTCGVSGRLSAVGPGVERLADEARSLFPEARIAVLSSDLFGSARALKSEIESIAAGSADIVIGTQLVAKGHNFPLLTLVGVIDADLGLMGSDLRAAERTFQLMRQVAGRAGRHGASGEALLQTCQPEHPVIRAILSGDSEGFWRAEAAERRAAGMPPYGRLAGIVVSSPEPNEAFDLADAMARHDEPLRAAGVQLFGPAPAPISRVRGRYRVRLLLKAAKSVPLQSAVSRWLALFKPPSRIRLSVDIDPQSFL